MAPVRFKQEEYLDALMAKISPEPMSGCWIWTGGKVREYGKSYVYINGKRLQMMAHRAVWTVLVGPIENGLTLDHLCRNPICVNPSHLEPVTLQENEKRARKKFCKRGHDMSLTRRDHKGKERWRYGHCHYCAKIHDYNRRGKPVPEYLSRRHDEHNASVTTDRC